MDLMRSSTKMLVCAEDLGSIPDCVPRVLEEKSILGLKIVRWARNWNAPGQPYYAVREYPNLSVCTPAVHDTSTLRQWWEEESRTVAAFSRPSNSWNASTTISPQTSPRTSFKASWKPGPSWQFSRSKTFLPLRATSAPRIPWMSGSTSLAQ
jgi:hypothetical protein